MKRGFCAFFLVLALCATATPAKADTFALPPAGISDYIVQVVAHISTSTPSITLEWPQENLEYSIYRKSPTSTAWGIAIGTVTNVGSYIDTGIVAGRTYEYQVTKNLSGLRYGYIYSGMNVPLVEDRGKVILVVDNTIAGGLATEISQLESDLVGDGWQVLRHDVARDAAVSTVRALIVADYAADPNNVKSVLLLGHVPVPYSGEINPDGHADHLGAWPADVYYGDVTNNAWTDTSVSTTVATSTRNHNIPGDGKFDQSVNSGDVKLSVGRVDMYDMPTFAPDTETDLLRQYLNRDHSYRFKEFTPAAQALIADNFFEITSDRFSQSAWSGFPSLVGAGNIATTSSGGYFNLVSSNSYLWTYGSGGGSYTAAGGIGNTANFAATTTYGAFNFLLGSYFGDWDTTNNFLRAPLAAQGYALTSAWSGLPLWYTHHMGMGETIGHSALATQNNSGAGAIAYTLGFGGNTGTHAGLMGDPTLRLNIVAPPASLAATDEGSGDVSLSWTGSIDANVLGYYIYRSTSAAGPFTRISDSLTATTTYTDTAAPSTGSYTYMVRAVKLETTPSGSYYNASNGIFDTVSVVVPAAPTMTTSPATAIGRTGATLNGSIDATGAENPTARGFYYGQTNIYGSTTTESGSFSTSTFSATLSSLDCGITYHFKAWASNPNGGTGSGSDASFTTSDCDPTPDNNSGGGGGGGGGGSSAPSALSTVGMPSTPEGLRAKIAELLNLIAILRARLGLSPASPIISGIAPSFSRNLNLGDMGEDVRGLQRYLNAHGFYISSSGPGSSGQETAYFGPATKNALAALQAAKGISPAVGYFGPATRAFINGNP